MHITEDLTWTNNTAGLAKKAQQRLYLLRKLRRARVPAPIMCTFYRGTIESILISCITVWYGTCNASCRKSLKRIVRAAEKIVGVSLPSLQDIYNTRLTCKALCIAGDPTHPTHSFFSPQPSGRRLRSLQARTSRLKDSFIHQAVRKLNSLPNLLSAVELLFLWHPFTVMVNLSKYFPIKKQTNLEGLSESTFSTKRHFRVNYFFKNIIWKLIIIISIFFYFTHALIQNGLVLCH